MRRTLMILMLSGCPALALGVELEARSPISYLEGLARDAGRALELFDLTVHAHRDARGREIVVGAPERGLDRRYTAVPGPKMRLGLPLLDRAPGLRRLGGRLDGHTRALGRPPSELYRVADLDHVARTQPPERNRRSAGVR